MFYLSFRISNSKKAFNIKILLTKSTVSLSLLSSGEKKYHHICLEFYMGLNPNYFGSNLEKKTVKIKRLVIKSNVVNHVNLKLVMIMSVY